jgi:hypothetical protein
MPIILRIKQQIQRVSGAAGAVLSRLSASLRCSENKSCLPHSSSGISGSQRRYRSAAVIDIWRFVRNFALILLSPLIFLR